MKAEHLGDGKGEKRPDPTKTGDAAVTDWVGEMIQQKFDHKLTFQRTIATDDKVVWEMIQELKRRGINPTKWIEDPKNPGGKEARSEAVPEGGD